MYTPRENLIHFFRNEPVEWKPVSTDMLNFLPEFVPEYIARGTVAQQKPFTGQYGGPDWFGVNWYYDPVSHGSMETMRLLDDISEWREKAVFPDLDAVDWQARARENAEYLNTDKLICATVYSGLFERLISFLGFEDAAVALIDEEQQEDVHELFERLTDFYIDYIRRMHRYFNVELVTVHDDWGTQDSLIFSEAVHRRMIEPYVRKLIKAVHDEGMIYDLHSCGKIDRLVPTIIDMGADTWRGQDTAVDKYELVKEYGGQFKFTVVIRADGPVDDETARKMMRELLDKYRDDNVLIAIGGGGAFTPEQRRIIDEMAHGA